MNNLRFAATKEDLRRYLKILSFIPIVAFGLVFTAFGSNNLTNSDLFIMYIILVGFSLPFLFSKVILNKDFFSLESLYGFLYYFVLYLAAFVISRTNLVTISQIYLVYGIINLIIWHFLIFRYLGQVPIEQIDDTVTSIVFIIIPMLAYSAVMAFLRHYLDLHSTDILVHKTVINGMENPSYFGVMPATYSTTFTDQGYPILIYHSFLFWILNSFGLNFVKFAYLVDLIFTFIGSLVIFKLVFSHTKKILISLAAIALTFFVFENLAYTFHFFIPQTFTFLFFAVILTVGKLNLKKLALAIVILVTAHFFIGAYLSVILIAKYLIVDLKILNKDNKFSTLQWPIVALLAFTAALSFANFSVEKTLQTGMVDWVGMVTNPSFNEKLQVLVNLWNFNVVVVLLAVGYFLYKKKKTDLEITAFIIFAASFGAYFLGPAFASKFLLGMGLATTILVISLVSDIKLLKYKQKVMLLTLIALSFVFSFALAYQKPLPFLTQNNGVVSALVDKDRDFIEYWTNSKLNCTLISDPQTQQEIHTFANGNTARGYYLTLETRNLIISFMTAPTQQKLERLYSIEELEGNKGSVCFALTARLTELVGKNHIWTQNIFNYKIDHDEILDSADKTLNFFESNNYEKLYQDGYIALFRIRD